MDDTEIGVLRVDEMRRVWSTVLAFERLQKMLQDRTDFNPQPDPILFRNDSGVQIPAYACMQISGTVEYANRNYFTVVRPFSWTGTLRFLFNGPWPVEPDDYGNAQPGPFYRCIGDGTSFSAGMRIGPVNAAFTVGKGCLYSYLGPDDLAANCIRVMTNETPILGVTTGSIPVGGSGPVTVRNPSAGAWSTGSVSYTAWNDSLTAIASGKRVKLWPTDAKWHAVEIC